MKSAIAGNVKLQARGASPTRSGFAFPDHRGGDAAFSAGNSPRKTTREANKAHEADTPYMSYTPYTLHTPHMANKANQADTPHTPHTPHTPYMPYMPPIRPIGHPAQFGRDWKRSSSVTNHQIKHNQEEKREWDT